MTKIALAMVAAAAMLMTAPLLVGSNPAAAQNVQMAQGVDIQVGRDRDRDYGDRRRRDRDLTVGVGPGGVVVGPRRERCRTVTTTVQRDDGRTITRRERQC